MNKNTTLIAVAVLLSLSMQRPGFASETQASSTATSCPGVQHVEGSYQCRGECAVQVANSTKLKVVQVEGERDRIQRLPGATAQMLQVEIHGNDGFYELEVGPLVGNTLSTATVEVSDQQYPVIEEYVFQTQNSCFVSSFTKTVRGLTPGKFKSCILQCAR